MPKSYITVSAACAMCCMHVRVLHFLTNFEIENARGAIRWDFGRNRAKKFFSIMTSF